MRENMSAAEYAEWQAFFSIEPMPALRADRRTAELKQVILATAGAKRVPKLAELLPDWWEEISAKQTPAQIAANLALALPRKKKKNAA